MKESPEMKKKLLVFVVVLVVLCLTAGCYLRCYLSNHLNLGSEGNLDLIEIQELEGKATLQKGIEIEVTVIPQESYQGWTVYAAAAFPWSWCVNPKTQINLSKLNLMID